MSIHEVGPKELQDQEQRMEKAERCDLCGAAMIDLHCKLICRQCGFKRDCSDP